MKEDYFEELNKLFIEKNFNETTLNQIVDKYKVLYNKLENEGKSQDEILVLLKSPEEVVSFFDEKLNVQKVKVENNINLEKESIKAEEEFIEEIVQVEEVLEKEVEEEVVKNNVEEVSDKINNESEHDPSIIIKTTKRGKTLLYRRRSFGGGIGIFLVFLLVSCIAIPILFSLFTATLTVSYASLVLFFTPIYYIVFINSFDTIGYIQPMQQLEVTQDGLKRFISLPTNYINEIIDQINSITTFNFTYFIQTILISIFAFALLLIFLYLTFVIFKINVNYFSYFFNKISLKKVKK